MKYLIHGGACGMVCCALNCSVSFHPMHYIWKSLIFKSNKLMPIYSSNHFINPMEFLKMTVNHINVNNNVLSWFKFATKISTKCLPVARILYKPTNQYQPHSTLLIQYEYTVWISLDACIEHVLGHGISIIYAHDSSTRPNLVGLHGSEQFQRVVNGILTNIPKPANTSVKVGYLWSDGFLGSNIIF